MKTSISIDSLITGPKKDLFQLPVIIRVTDFNQKAAADFAAQMSRAHNHNQPVIPVLIDSPGGRVYDLLRMLSEIERSEKPVATIAVGRAMSCAASLLAAGTPGYRYADINSSIMVHDISGGAIGKGEDLVVNVAEASRLKNLVMSNLAKHCGHPDRKYFSDLLRSNNNTNFYMTAKQAKKHKLVDHVGMPSMSVSVEVVTQFNK